MLKFANFQGLDTRFIAGNKQDMSLLQCNNAVVENGEIVSLEGLQELGAFGADTFGLYVFNGDLVTFGSVVSPDLPTGVVYHRLSVGSGAAMQTVHSVQQFGNFLYVVAEYDDGQIIHWYNSSIVADWLPVNTEASSSLQLVWQWFASKIERKYPELLCGYSGYKMSIQGPVNTAFTVAATVVNKGTQPNAANVAIVQAATSTKPQKVEITFTGSWEAADEFSITVNGTQWTTSGSAIAVPKKVIACNARMWTFLGTTLYYSALENPTTWDVLVDDTAGFIEAANYQHGAQQIRSITAFNDLLFVQSEGSGQIWNVPVDDDAFSLAQTFPLAATPLEISAQQADATVLLVVTQKGIRAITPRQAVLGQFITAQEGAQLDKLLAPILASLTEEEKSQALSFYWPAKNRYYLFLRENFGVVAQLGDQITWSTVSFGEVLTHVALRNAQCYLRSKSHKLLAFSADANLEATIQTQWIVQAEKTMYMHLLGILEGRWQVFARINLAVPQTKTSVGWFDAPTTPVSQQLTLKKQTNTLSLELKGSGRLGSILVT